MDSSTVSLTNKIFSLACQPIYNSAKNTARPKFQEMLSYVREGDMIVVHSMDRFARSLKDLVTEVDQLVKRGVAIQFIKRTLPSRLRPLRWIT